MKDETSNEYFLGVLCGTIGIYEIFIKLNDDEIEKFKKDEKGLKSLAEKIRYKPKNFSERIIKDFIE